MIRRMLPLLMAITMLVASPSDASIPPPPPRPPAELPAEYDGYGTEALWYAYVYWVREQTAVRREAAFDALRLPAWLAGDESWRTVLEGPHYVSRSYWIPYGLHFAFEQVCPASAGYDRDPKGCLWRYRSAFFAAQESDINAIVFDTFDGAAFASYLAARGVGPEDVTSAYRSDFGLEDLVNERLDALIVTRDIREDACPQVGEAIVNLAQISLPLSPFGPPEGTPPPPPPLPPGADAEILTIPSGFFPDTQVRIVFEGNGTGTLQMLVSRLAGPVRACISDTPE